MTNDVLQDVQSGWKVYAHDREVGRVAQVSERALTVSRGTLVHHEYRVPAEYIAEAGNGVVDLRLDPEELNSFELGAD
jgi:hypothetical protein